MSRLAIAFTVVLLTMVFAPTAHAQFDGGGSGGSGLLENPVGPDDSLGAITNCIRNDGCYMCTVDTNRCALVLVNNGGCSCANVRAGYIVTTCKPSGYCSYM